MGTENKQTLIPITPDMLTKTVNANTKQVVLVRGQELEIIDFKDLAMQVGVEANDFAFENITLTTPNPTKKGFYFPTESGVYPNFGGIQVTEEKLQELVLVILFDGVNFNLIEKSFPALGHIIKGDLNSVNGDKIYNYINNIQKSEDDLHNIDLTIQNHTLKVKNEDALIFSGRDNLSTTVFLLITAEENSNIFILGANVGATNVPYHIKKETYYYAVITVVNKDEIIIDINEGVKKFLNTFSYGDFINNEITKLETGEEWIKESNWMAVNDLAYYSGVRDIDHFLKFKSNNDYSKSVITSEFGVLDWNAGIIIFGDNTMNTGIFIGVDASGFGVAIQLRIDGVNSIIGLIPTYREQIYSLTVYRNNNGFSFYINNSKGLDYYYSGDTSILGNYFGFYQGAISSPTGYISRFKSFKITAINE